MGSLTSMVNHTEDVTRERRKKGAMWIPDFPPFANEMAVVSSHIEGLTH